MSIHKYYRSIILLASLAWGKMLFTQAFVHRSPLNNVKAEFICALCELLHILCCKYVDLIYRVKFSPALPFSSPKYFRYAVTCILRNANKKLPQIRRPCGSCAKPRPPPAGMKHQIIKKRRRLFAPRSLLPKRTRTARERGDAMFAGAIVRRGLYYTPISLSFSLGETGKSPRAEMNVAGELRFVWCRALQCQKFDRKARR